MKNQVLNNRNKTADNVLKATALVYLKEALLKEDYEHCALLAAQVRKYGASESEIKTILNEAVLGIGTKKKGQFFRK